MGGQTTRPGCKPLFYWQGEQVKQNKHIKVGRISLFVLGLLCSTSSVWAASESPSVPEDKSDFLLEVTPQDDETSRVLKENLQQLIATMDPLQAYMGEKVNYYGLQVDRWFGGREDFSFEKSNRIEVVFPLIYQQKSGSMRLDPSVKARLYLPRMQKKLQLIVDSTGDTFFGDSAQTTPYGQNNQPALQQENFLISLRRTLFENEWFDVSADAGSRFTNLRPDPVTGLRVKFSMPSYSEHKNSLLQKFYWQSSIGRVADTQYLHDWLLSNPLLLRYQTGLTWWASDVYWSHAQSLTLYQSINHHRSFSYSISGLWKTQDNNHFANMHYGLNVSLRERVYSDWFFAALTPFVNYRHDLEKQHYYFEPGIVFGLEAHFFERKKH